MLLDAINFNKKFAGKENNRAALVEFSQSTDVTNDQQIKSKGIDNSLRLGVHRPVDGCGNTVYQHP